MEAALAPTFPPLLKGVPVGARVDPLQKAVAAASVGDPEPGLVHYAETDTAFRVALTLLPEAPLETAVQVGFAVMLGLSDALGALAPPEVAVHFTWPSGIKVNGARCGNLRMRASTTNPQDEPDWLIAALDLAIGSQDGVDPGATPDQTTLYDEGCGEVTAPALIESWSRHSLVWINRYLDEGFAPLHAAWREKCDTIGEDVTVPVEGTFVGLDEHGGMLVRHGDQTVVRPLTEILEAN